MTKDALREDKERMDAYCDKIARQEPVKEWAVIYWLLVAVGHLLEWAVTHGKGNNV